MTKEERILSAIEFFVGTYGDISIVNNFESELGEHYEVTLGEGGLLESWTHQNTVTTKASREGLHEGLMRLMIKHRDKAHQQAKYLDAQIKGYKMWREHGEELTTPAD